MAAALVMPALTSCQGDLAEPPMPLPEGIFNEDHVIGKGTWEVPLTCYQASIGTKPEGMTDNVWVSGYIVGWVNSDISATLKQESAIFSAPASAKSNILLSDYTPAELEEKFVEKDAQGTVTADTRWEHVVPVQLVYDTDPRLALNLGDYPANLGKRVSVMGETNVKYFGAYSVKFTSAYNWGSQGKDIPAPIPGTFTLTDTFTPDAWYLIGYEKNVAKTFESARSFLSTTAVNPISSTTISLKDIRKNGFYFESTETAGKYRIRMGNGLYLCTDGTDTAYHSTENPDQSICLFTVAPAADGTFTIKANNGSQMMYDTQYGSFGLYLTITANHFRPNLYIRTK